tara:strand:+ start:438 stop:719 length:282 start_codon:yes stop_codon:yes gene_type:complete
MGDEASLSHFTVVSEAWRQKPEAGQMQSAIVSLKVWETGSEAALRTLIAVARSEGLDVVGPAETYATDPLEPQQSGPFAYDFQVTDFDPDAED